ncbi:hypothetical protein [Dethiobacter alkaliphilus]|uniref:Uncharacterized protein n=1 Tax=Dethiobacter alkaliphilus AHT 1 TaxID=555088 RepID=C0GGL5_DETAL|nr:hypothetical protein [Dethiobacter alkaliphilus]EEG77456.1 hypothetical protein DealDRAFT_1579 [Dethiobacter alkaliphilus AHT 1]
MRKATWIYLLLFLIVLIMTIYLLIPGIPRVPMTDPPEGDAWGGQIDEGMPPYGQVKRDGLTVLICDPSSARGAEFIVLNIPDTGEIRALYIAGSAEVGGEPLGRLDDSEAVVEALSEYLAIDNYIVTDMSLVDDFFGQFSTGEISALTEEASPLEFFQQLLQVTGENSSGLASTLWEVAGSIETDLSPSRGLQLVNRLNQVRPEEIRLSTILSTKEFEAEIRRFVEGR